jgi:hypothetical protein
MKSLFQFLLFPLQGKNLILNLSKEKRNDK